MDEIERYVPDHFIFMERDFIYDMYRDHKIKPTISPLSVLQKGGTETEKYVRWIDEGGVYRFKVYINDRYENDPQQIHIVITTVNDDECFTVAIDVKTKLALINNMTYYKECAIPGLLKPGGGNILLRFGLNLVLQHKDKYGFNKIVLKDNSFLGCGDCSGTIKLARLRLVTHGETWYMKYGFRPYEIDTETGLPVKGSTDELLKRMKRNGRMLDTLKTKDIPITKIMNKAIKSEGLNVDMRALASLINGYPLLRDLIGRLIKEFDKYCCIVRHTLDYIFDIKQRVGLTDFFGQTFFLDV